MMKLAIARCFSESVVKAILVDPLARNTRAHKFYENLGFRFVESRQFAEDDCFVYRLNRADWQYRNRAWTLNLNQRSPISFNKSKFYGGGWRPNSSSSARIARIKARFIRRALIVARPVAVSPTTWTPAQRKCSAHTCRRGLKIATVFPVSGSSTICRADLWSEHDTQATVPNYLHLFRLVRQQG